MESINFKNITAFKLGTQAPLAFHSENLELAEISEDLWNFLKSPHHADSLSSEELLVLQELESWSADVSKSSDKISDSSRRQGSCPKIKSLTINTSQICNLACHYCAAGGDGTYGSPHKFLDIEKALPQLKYLITRLEENDHFGVTFLGGEPLLYPEAISHIANYLRLLVAGKNIQLKFSLVTNGTLITAEIANLLASLNCHITISLDGPQEINDQVRPRKDGKSTTAAILTGLENLQKVRKDLGSLRVHGVFDAKNTKLQEAYLFYRQLSVDKYQFTFSVDENDLNATQKYIEQMTSVAQLAFEQGGEVELRKIDFFDSLFRSLDNQSKTINHCGYKKSLAVMNTQGELYSCPWLVGKKEEKIDPATLSASNEKSLVEQNNCGTCWARYLCGGGCTYIHRKDTGSPVKKSPTFCLRTQNLIALGFLYYKKTRKGVVA